MSWYKTWWGIILLTILGVVVLAGLVFAGVTVQYWYQIKSGKLSLGNLNNSTSTIGNLYQNNITEIETTDDPFMGSPVAKLVIVEFVDFKCPNCLTSHPIMKKVMQNYSHKVKRIIRDFPAESLHPGAGELAELAYCANKQNKFWKLADVLFEQQNYLPSSLTFDIKTTLYNSVNLDSNQMEQCLQSGEAKIEVNKDFADGVRFGVVGTPTFFINGKKVEGVVSYDNWVKVIEAIK